MKNLYSLVFLLFVTFNNLYSQRIFGINLDGAGNKFTSVDPVSGDFIDIATLQGISGLNNQTAFDVNSNKYAATTNLGITIIDATNGEIIKSISNPLRILGIEFLNSTTIIGLYWNGSQEIFTSLNIETEIRTDLAVVPGVLTITNQTSFDPNYNRYVINTNLGIVIINVTDGSIIKIIENPLRITGLKFDCFENIFGVYWTGSEEIFTSINISTEIITDIAVLPGVTSKNNAPTYDVANNRYAINTNLGLTIIDASDGTILYVHNGPPSNFVGMRYENNCSYVVDSCGSFERD